jgi:hypothetical protein
VPCFGAFYVIGNCIAPLAGGKRLAATYLPTVYKIGLYQIIKSGIFPPQAGIMNKPEVPESGCTKSSKAVFSRRRREL